MLGMGLAGMVWPSRTQCLAGQPLPHARTGRGARARLHSKLPYKSNLPFSDVGTSGMQGVDAALGKAIADRLKPGVQWLPFEAGENHERRPAQHGLARPLPRATARLT